MRTRAILLSALVVAACVHAPAAAEQPLLVAAHRGGSLIGPENTIAAFASAQDLFGQHPDVNGWLEMDARLSADDVPVVIHDATLDRTTDCTGRVRDLTASALALCNAASAWPSWGFQPVSSVRQVFESAVAAPTAWKIMIEIKDIVIDPHYDLAGTIARELVSIVHDTSLPYENLIVQSFWPPFLDLVSLLDPRITTMLLTTSTLPGAPEGAGFTLMQNAAFSTARGYAISAPDAGATDMTADGVAFAHALGRDVVTWTVNTPAEISRVLDAGVDGVISDDPRLLL